MTVYLRNFTVIGCGPKDRIKISLTSSDDLFEIVANGDEVTVDSYLGIVTIKKPEGKKYP